MTTVQDVSKFKMLTDIEHVLLRPGRYLGSTTTVEELTWSIVGGKVEERRLSINPAFNKLFDEIISNSADHAKRPEGKHLNKIEVSVNKIMGTICVKDNGGIPVLKHPDTGLWIPDMIFGHLRSGSNFDDSEDSTGTGQNGEGSSLVNIFSTFFRVDTGDGKNHYSIVYENNLTVRGKEEITPASGASFTAITYVPDFTRLGMTGLTDDAVLLIERRCYEIAATNPNIQVSFNGQLIKVRSFKDFAALFNKEVVFQSIDRWNVALIHSVEGFKHSSYVNSTNTYQGGTHIEYVMDKIVEGIREHIEKKTKQKIKPSEIKSQFHLFLDATINNPRYSSQTKENLITVASKYGSQFEVTDKFIKDIIASPIMKRILEWAERRKIFEEAKEAQKEVDEARKATFHHIEKYHGATEKDRSKCVLFVAEGDSALKPLRAAKSSHHGVFPLRGKPDNVFGQSIKSLTKKKEFQDLLQIMGLDLSGNVDPSVLRYGAGIMVSTDADLDGIHIRGLLTVAFQRFWPQLIEKGLLKFLKTPMIMCRRPGEIHEFFNEEEFKAWEAVQTKKFNFKYIKGLGGHETADMERFMTDPKYTYTVLPLDATDQEMLNMAFDPNRADDRKTFLGIHA
jgi:DNA topoisomerase-2